MPHSNESVLTQKEPVKYTNKKTTDIKLQNETYLKIESKDILKSGSRNCVGMRIPCTSLWLRPCTKHHKTFGSGDENLCDCTGVVG